MRVIEYKHIKPKYAFCTGCGAILEFNKTDYKMSNISLSKGIQGNGKDYLVHCPVCSRSIYEESFKDTIGEC